MKLTKEEKAKVKKAERDRLAAEAISLHIAGLSTREIAKRLNSSAATISRILTGKTPIPTTTTIIPPAQPTKDTIDLKGSVAPKALVGTHTIVDVNTMVANINTAIADIVDQIAFVTSATTSIDKLAVAADKLAAVAERIANIQRIAQQQTQDNASINTFMSDFASRHINGKN